MKKLSALEPRLQGEVELQTTEFSGAITHFREESTSPLRWMIALLVLVFLPGLARPQESSPPQNLSGNDYTISVNVDLVVLRATAQDHKKALVSGLGKDNFQVYENEVLQQIKYFSHEDIPVTVGLVIDNSSSMRPKRHHVTAAALAFARSSNPLDQIFVVKFNEKVSFGLPDDMPFTDNTAQLETALSQITADGQTALYDAVAAALEHLKQGNRDKKVLIVVSDGGDNASKYNLAKIVSMAEKSNAILYTIGIYDEQDPDQNPHALKQLAKNTGGEAFFPQSLNDIGPICEGIAHDIRNQYTLAYVPTNRMRDGTYRVIQVKASAPGRGRLSVRTRTGYFAPSAGPPTPAKAIAHETHN